MIKNSKTSEKALYAAPNCKCVSMRTRRSVLTGSLDGVYGSIPGSAGSDGSYDPYNDENDL